MGNQPSSTSAVKRLKDFSLGGVGESSFRFSPVTDEAAVPTLPESKPGPAPVRRENHAGFQLLVRLGTGEWKQDVGNSAGETSYISYSFLRQNRC